MAVKVSFGLMVYVLTVLSRASTTTRRPPGSKLKAKGTGVAETVATGELLSWPEGPTSKTSMLLPLAFVVTIRREPVRAEADLPGGSEEEGHRGVGRAERAVRAGDHREVVAGEPVAPHRAGAALKAGIQDVDEVAMHRDAHGELAARGHNLLEQELVAACDAEQRDAVAAAVDREEHMPAGCGYE